MPSIALIEVGVDVGEYIVRQHAGGVLGQDVTNVRADCLTDKFRPASAAVLLIKVLYFLHQSWVDPELKSLFIGIVHILSFLSHGAVERHR